MDIYSTLLSFVVE